MTNLDVHLNEINLNNFHNRYFSEYSYLIVPEVAVQKCSVKMLIHRKTLVAESYYSKVTGLNPVTLLY